jgi:hypothetical protein
VKRKECNIYEKGKEKDLLSLENKSLLKKGYWMKYCEIREKRKEYGTFKKSKRGF